MFCGVGEAVSLACKGAPKVIWILQSKKAERKAREPPFEKGPSIRSIKEGSERRGIKNIGVTQNRGDVGAGKSVRGRKQTLIGERAR